MTKYLKWCPFKIIAAELEHILLVLFPPMKKRIIFHYLPTIKQNIFF